MTCNEALSFIHNIARFGSKPGLRRVTMLLERMGNPQDRLKFIHVAGTNGKGSTCTMLSYILEKAGYNTGLYISPFVLDFRERIQLNNQMISPEDLAACTAVVKGHWDALDAIGETPTEFEVVVAVAMEYFTRMKADVVVLEVGMGGRFDATNVIGTPLCSIITSIGLDHVEYLGDTIEKIAAEKAGIIKPGGITVCYPLQNPDALAVIMEQCALRENPLYIPAPGSARILEEDIEGTRIRWKEQEFYIPLGGQHQVCNTLMVLEAVELLRAKGYAISPEALGEGIASTRFPSRLEILCRRPLALLDGAHNYTGAQALGGALKLLGERAIHAVMGMMADKEADMVLREILPCCASLITTTPKNPRAMPATRLAALAEPYCPDVTAIESPRAAAEAVFARSEKDDVILLFGSLYLASELRPIVLELSKDV